MGAIKDLFENLSEAVKQYFGGGDSAESHTPADQTIEIKERHSGITWPPDSSSADAPKIKIGEVHTRESAAIRDVYRDGVNVVNQNIGKGITVNKQRKPGKCPICATQGRVEANVNGGDKWICEECGNTFN